jgi:hypothetical protein
VGDSSLPYCYGAYFVWFLSWDLSGFIGPTSIAVNFSGNCKPPPPDTEGAYSMVVFPGEVLILYLSLVLLNFSDTPLTYRIDNMHTGFLSLYFFIAMFFGFLFVTDYTKCPGKHCTVSPSLSVVQPHCPAFLTQCIGCVYPALYHFSFHIKWMVRFRAKTASSIESVFYRL